MLYNFDGLSFQILTVDRFYHKEGFFSVKARPYAALSLRIKGTGAFKIGNKSFLTKPGDVLFIPADTPYEVDYSVSESIVANLPSCNYTEAELFDFEGQSGVSLLFLKLLEEWNEGHSVNRAKAGIYNILEKINEEKETMLENTAFSCCLDYIKENFCDPMLDVAAVCEIGFISSSCLQRSFLRHFGVSPKQYIIKLRMEKALQLLAENRLSVKEIAAACGFSDEKYFSRAVRNKYGYSPTQLRNYIV